jgi:hypothetical protein
MGKSVKKAAKRRKLSAEAETRDAGDTHQNDSQDEEMRDDTG